MLQVYLEVGFEDLSHFSFVFKKEFGKTPSEVAAEV
ncbi:MAG TPA: helix-turn-helix domain-containing protein [Chitinophaga sp.]